MVPRFTNHSYVNWKRMASSSLPLSCTTPVTQCCNSSQGTWVAPNGVQVTTDTNSSVYQEYGRSSIDLYVTSGCSGNVWSCIDVIFKPVVVEIW